MSISAPILLSQNPSDADTQLTLVKHHVAASLQNQPYCTCLATFDRYRKLANEPAENKIDTVRVEVAYVGNRELYSWPGDVKFSDTPLTSMVTQGTIGDGTFAAQVHNVFVEDVGVERYIGDEGKLWHWAYRISVAESARTVQAADRELHNHEQQVGSDGSFWIDAKTLDLVRMETYATDFLSNFPLKSVDSTVNYSRVRIGSQDTLLPVRAELTTVSREGDRNRNIVEYSNCRQYAGQSTITFDAPASTAAAPEAPKIVEEQLPAGLLVHIRLPGEFNVALAAVGDAVEGTLNEAIRDGKTQIAPKGARVHGRVRTIEKSSTTASGKLLAFADVGLAFDELAFEGHLFHFAAKLKSFDTPVRGALVSNFKLVGNVPADQQIWPSSFSIDLRSGGLPKGTLMTWVTK